ncbi:hypothetical protein T484DRAFT_1921476 [Baffinella frigidus]|nr:hypothetical protein T484DRAFT_1921476 [Cryptophyta sp. CCMP2293]
MEVSADLQRPSPARPRTVLDDQMMKQKAIALALQNIRSFTELGLDTASLKRDLQALTGVDEAGPLGGIEDPGARSRGSEMESIPVSASAAPPAERPWSAGAPPAERPWSAPRAKRACVEPSARHKLLAGTAAFLRAVVAETNSSKSRIILRPAGAESSNKQTRNELPAREEASGAGGLWAAGKRCAVGVPQNDIFTASRDVVGARNFYGDRAKMISDLSTLSLMHDAVGAVLPDGTVLLTAEEAIFGAGLHSRLCLDYNTIPFVVDGCFLCKATLKSVRNTALRTASFCPQSGSDWDARLLRFTHGLKLLGFDPAPAGGAETVLRTLLAGLERDCAPLSGQTRIRTALKVEEYPVRGEAVEIDRQEVLGTS